MVEELDGIPAHKPEDGGNYTNPDDSVNLFKLGHSQNVKEIKPRNVA